MNLKKTCECQNHKIEPQCNNAALHFTLYA